MKALISGVAVASAAALALATPAQAAPKDPVAAVKKQLVAGKGVSFADTTTWLKDDGTEPYLKRKGKLMFGKGTVAATDMASTYPKETLQRGLDSFQNDRTILVGKVAYLSGSYYRKQLPEGKTWLKSDGAALSNNWAQPINPAEPATLKKLLAKAERTSNGYQGTITFDQLGKVSPWFNLSVPIWSAGGTEVTWKLTVGRDGLPKRLVTSYPAGGLVRGWPGTFKIDTAYRGWGAKVSIKAPPAGQVSAE
ncbi:hypothetical protein [Nonomuraea sp. SBT364]|uniref:hypothetical protein n=1 Tax=Nonomuraea sp. SBT364 TaxID=1580530 RepID=UPI000B081109|nr:hypothetical protein [Nonomuraea sp. SBT364]